MNNKDYKTKLDQKLEFFHILITITIASLFKPDRHGHKK